MVRHRRNGGSTPGIGGCDDLPPDETKGRRIIAPYLLDRKKCLVFKLFYAVSLSWVAWEETTHTRRYLDSLPVIADAV